MAHQTGWLVTVWVSNCCWFHGKREVRLAAPTQVCLASPWAGRHLLPNCRDAALQETSRVPVMPSELSGPPALLPLGLGSGVGLA